MSFYVKIGKGKQPERRKKYAQNNNKEKKLKHNQIKAKQKI